MITSIWSGNSKDTGIVVLPGNVCGWWWEELCSSPLAICPAQLSAMQLDTGMFIPQDAIHMNSSGTCVQSFQILFNFFFNWDLVPSPISASVCAWVYSYKLHYYRSKWCFSDSKYIFAWRIKVSPTIILYKKIKSRDILLDKLLCDLFVQSFRFTYFNGCLLFQDIY